MTSRAALLMLVLFAIASLAAFAMVVRRLASATVSLAAHREIEQQLRASLDDQKTLTRLDPAGAAEHRRRFDSTAALLGHLRVVQFNRQQVAREVEQLLVGLAALVLASGFAVYLVERRGRERRLVRLEAALLALSRGEPEVTLGDRRQDVIGRIAAAVERSARVASNDRRRLRYLEHLSAWQEASRRHAHEIRTPLAAARMEVERLAAAATRHARAALPEVEDARASILEELDHLGEFTRTFTSFATIPRPRVRALDLRQLVADFATTFASAWPGVRLVARCAGEDAAPVLADGEMLRQVLANLANNSALAIGAAGGNVTLDLRRSDGMYVLEVSDDGPGVAPEIKGRLFEPYTTTRAVGEGMGLGLAISKKIMLDHGGDLDYVDSGSHGATFRLTVPAVGEGG